MFFFFYFARTSSLSIRFVLDHFQRKKFVFGDQEKPTFSFPCSPALDVRILSFFLGCSLSFSYVFLPSPLLRLVFFIPRPFGSVAVTRLSPLLWGPLRRFGRLSFPSSFGVVDFPPSSSLEPSLLFNSLKAVSPSAPRLPCLPPLY